jgi:hypothetical protein
MECPAALIVARFRVGVAVDSLQRPFRILELQFLILLHVHLLLPPPLVGGRAILVLLLLHLLAELFRELLDLLAFRRGVACGVVHWALCAAFITIRLLAGALVTSLATSAPTGRYCSCYDRGCLG